MSFIKPLILMFSMLISVQVLATVYPVPWSYPTIQDAIDVCEDDDTVKVYPGTYTDSFSFQGKNILVTSLFYQNGDSTYIHSTILDGENTHQIALFAGDEGSAAVLNGFTLTRGSGFNGAAIYIPSSSTPTLKNLVLDDNHASHWGGAIYCASNADLINLTFTNNTADNGAGIYAYHAAPSVIDCWFIDNSANGWGGGGIYLDHYSSIITGSYFKGNHANNGGGAVYCHYADPTISYTTFIENDAPGAAIYCHDSSPDLNHVTFVGNIGNDVGGGAIRGYGSSYPTLNNSIIWGNVPNQFFTSSPSTININNSCVEGGWPGPGNIDLDPGFCDPDNGEYSVSMTSPCFMNGENWATMGSLGVGCDIIGGYEGTLRYVSLSGSDDTGTGSEANPFRSIQWAIAWSAAGDTVLIEPGTYTDVFSFTGKDVIVASRFFLDSDSTHIYNTTLDGENSRSIVSFTGEESTNAILEGFTLTRGAAENGGAVYIETGSTPTLRNLIFDGNNASDEGGAIYVASNAEFQECRFLDNSATEGGAIYVNEGSPVFQNCWFENNVASSLGGSIYLDQGPATITESYFKGNDASNGGGAIYCNSADPYINFATFYNNNSPGAAVYCLNSSPVMNQLTVTGNMGNENGVGAISSYGNSFPILINSIVWGNIPEQLFNSSNSSIYATYSCVEFGWIGDGNFDDNPQLCDMNGDSLGVALTSPCVSAGQNGETIGSLGVGCDSIAIFGTTLLNVSPTGSDIDGDGSQQNPFQSIQQAIYWSTRGDTVLVHPGTYAENISFGRTRIFVASKYLTTLDSAYVDSTIIDGNFDGSVVTIDERSNEISHLVGFSIINGRSENGGGVYIGEENGPVLSNLKLVGNSAVSYGGAIYCGPSSNPVLVRLNVTGNMAEYGGGVASDNGALTIQNSMIENNLASTGGGGMFSTSANLIMSSVRVGDNTAGSTGAAIHISNTVAELDYLTVVGNNSAGAAIYCNESNPSINQTTLVGNTGFTSGGIYVEGNSYPIFINSIVWGNTPSQMQADTSSDIAVFASCIQGGWTGLGNIDEDPLFCDTESSNYQLAEDSPCIGVGIGAGIIGSMGIGCLDPVATIEPELPQNYAMEQNFPNPFNPSTTIRYGLPEDSNASLTIYNVRGQVIQTLHSGHQSPGWYEVVWNGETADGYTISTGIYFVRLIAGDYSQVIKMLMIK